MMLYAYVSFRMVEAYERGQIPAVDICNLTRYDGSAGILTKKIGSGNVRSTPAYGDQEQKAGVGADNRSSQCQQRHAVKAWA
jgi:hypothetical protein